MPESNAGSKYPKHQGQTCYGRDLTNHEFISEIHLQWLINAYQNTSNPDEFFNSFFTKLAGTTLIEQQIKKGMTSEQIKATWQADLEKFKVMKAKYHLY